MTINKDIIRMQSDMCKTFSNPYRMHIVKLLCQKEMSAAELLKETGLSKANLSQHMSVLTGKGAVISRRQGVNAYYNLADKKINQACSLMQEAVINIVNKKHSVITRLR